jgi:hypothetical protein
MKEESLKVPLSAAPVRWDVFYYQEFLMLAIRCEY